MKVGLTSLVGRELVKLCNWCAILVENISIFLGEVLFADFFVVEKDFKTIWGLFKIKSNILKNFFFEVCGIN